MTPETQKKVNVTAGSTLSVLGLICFVIAFYVATVPAVPRPAPVSPQPIVNTSSCRDVLTQMGYTATLINGGVTAKDVSLDDPQAALTKATAALGLCKLKLSEFCMGSGCADPGLTFTLIGNPKAEAAAAKKPGEALARKSASETAKK